MIPRYTRPEMADLWTEERRHGLWLSVELLALEAMEEEGTVPKGTYKEVAAKAKINPARALEIEEEVRHDVIAFLTSVAESAGEKARYLHRGMTSNDLLDTSFAVQLREAGLLIEKELKGLLVHLKKRAEEFRYVPCIGRSHGIHAEPTTFGIKLLSFYAEGVRCLQTLRDAIEVISYGKIAGAVGTYASVSPRVESHVLGRLNLRPEPVPSQVVHRDRHAKFFTALALIGSSMERLAVELRHLQRTEVGEVEEGFQKGQKGSSAMPHKKNPISGENITGLARLLRGYALSAMENVALWHERDISHSSVERVIAPDATTVIHYMLARMKGIVEGLVVHPEKMMENLESTKGLIFSGTLLIALADKGISREDSYRIVQRHAMEASLEKGFPVRVKEDPEIRRMLTQEELQNIFDMKRHLRFVDEIFERTIQSEDI